MLAKSKYDNMTAEDISELAKPLTPAEEEEVEELFTPYVFYRTLGDGRKECFCSYCKEHYIYELPRTFSNDEIDFLNSKHNDTAVCPKCGVSAYIKNIGKIKSGESLWEQQRVVVTEVISTKTVLLKCYYATKEYKLPWYGRPEKERFLTPCEIQLSAVYLLRPGKAVKARLDGYGWGSWGEPHWSIYKRHGEPFVAMFGGDTSYTFIGLEKLQKTFLKYAAYKDYKNIFYPCPNNPYAQTSYNACVFFSYSAELPALEVVTKLGWAEVVKDVIYRHSLNNRLINWQALKPWEIFRLPKEEYKVFEKYCMKSETAQYSYKTVLKIYRDLQKLRIKGGMNRACLWTDITGGLYRWKETVLPKLKNGMNLTHLENYLQKQKTKKQSLSNVLIEWGDYLRMAEQLQYDLTQEVVIFPKKLKNAHDTAEKNLRLIREQQLQKEREELRKKAEPIIKGYEKKYAYSNGEYSIILPTCAEDIIREGKLMHHCVGGYADRHFNGILCICFLRKNSEIDKPYYTIEMRDKTLGQIQGAHNRHPISEDPKAEEFFNEWLAWVKNGSKKQKKDKTKETVTAA